MKCPNCQTDWEKNCEQAIRVELFGKCICCAFNNGENLKNSEICLEKSKRLYARSFRNYIRNIRDDKRANGRI